METRPRKWWIAGLLSLFEPGLGQIYNGQAQKGFIFIAVSFFVYPLMILSVKAENLLIIEILFAALAVLYYIIVISDAVYHGYKNKTG